MPKNSWDMPEIIIPQPEILEKIMCQIKNVANNPQFFQNIRCPNIPWKIPVKSPLNACYPLVIRHDNGKCCSAISTLLHHQILWYSPCNQWYFMVFPWFSIPPWYVSSPEKKWPARLHSMAGAQHRLDEALQLARWQGGKNMEKDPGKGWDSYVYTILYIIYIYIHNNILYI